MKKIQARPLLNFLHTLNKRQHLEIDHIPTKGGFKSEDTGEFLQF